jgi:hypothetical protein
MIEFDYDKYLCNQLEKTQERPPVIYSCDQCGDDICENAEYADINGLPWCIDCIKDCIYTA